MGYLFLHMLGIRVKCALRVSVAIGCSRICSDSLRMHLLFLTRSFFIFNDMFERICIDSGRTCTYLVLYESLLFITVVLWAFFVLHQSNILANDIQPINSPVSLPTGTWYGMFLLFFNNMAYSQSDSVFLQFKGALRGIFRKVLFKPETCFINIIVAVCA